MPADIEDLTVMRVVVRNGVSIDLIRLLTDDIRSSVSFLNGLGAPIPRPDGSATPFHH
jgi:glutamate decarboxylase